MSALIKESLTGLDEALDRLEIAIQQRETKFQDKLTEAGETKPAFNDNGKSELSVNAEKFALRLDNAIDKVERLLREG